MDRALTAIWCWSALAQCRLRTLAEQAGLRIDNGIAVDDQLRTSDPDIFAAGDCVSFPLTVYGGRRVRLESWRAAQDQGALAAANMLGKRRATGDRSVVLVRPV